MGTFYTNDSAHLTNRQFVAMEKPQSVTDFSVIGNVAYLLGNGGLEVWLLSRHDGAIGYKPMAEEMHPYYYACPIRLLNAAKPTRDANAQKWRQACRDYHARRNRAKRLKGGQTVQFENKLSFGPLGSHDTFTVCRVTYNHKSILAFRIVNPGHIADGRVVRITRLTDRNYSVA